MTIRIRDRRVYWGVMALALILAGALGHHVVYGEHGYFTYRSEQRRYLELKRQTDKLKNDNESLQKEIDAINHHDRDVIEEKAREQQLVKQGEKIYVYNPPDSPSNGGSKPADLPPASGSQP
jgi:cell division protein FtsB